MFLKLPKMQHNKQVGVAQEVSQLNTIDFLVKIIKQSNKEKFFYKLLKIDWNKVEFNEYQVRDMLKKYTHPKTTLAEHSLHLMKCKSCIKVYIVYKINSKGTLIKTNSVKEQNSLVACLLKTNYKE